MKRKTDVDVLMEDLWFFWCIRKIDFRWDQWMVCYITCKHGTYRGVSDGYTNAMGQSMSRAMADFMTECEKHDYENE